MKGPELDEISELVFYAGKRGITRLTVETKRTRFSVEFGQTSVPKPTALRTRPSLRTVRTPGLGEFLTHPASTSAPLVQPGSSVRVGDILGLLRIGPVYRAIRSPVCGRLRRVLARPGEVLGYAAEAFEIESAEPVE